MSHFKFNSHQTADQFKTSALLSSKIASNVTFSTTISISLLIFLSIIPLAVAEAWNEAIVVTAIFVLSGLNLWINKTEIENRQLLTPIIILAVYSFLQGFATLLFPVYSAVFPISFDPTASIWSGFKILAFALFFDLLLKISRRSIKILTWSLVITGNFFAVFGIARFLLQPIYPRIFESLISPKLTMGIGFGTYFNQNHFAYLMLMVFGLNLCLFWYGKLSKAVGLLLIVASLTTWTALILTSSRGGIISSFVVIAVLIFLPVIMTVTNNRKSRKKPFQSKLALVGKPLIILAIIFGLLIIGIVLIGQDKIIGRFEEIPRQIGGITNAATFRRTDAWQAALLIIKDFPLWGIGFGGYQIAVSQYIDISGQLVPKQAHNDYLELAASGGIVTAALTIWFLIRFFPLVKKRFAESPDSFSGAARAGAICGIAGVALHSFFDFGLQITANLLFFVALLCLAVHKPQSHNKTNADSSTQKNIIFFNSIFSILFFILACLAAFFGFARYQLEQAKTTLNIGFIENKLYKIPFDADYYETKAVVYEDFGKFDSATNELKNAIEYRPKDYNLWIKLGQIEQSQNHITEAENAFRRAIELAPRYGKPYFSYGNFLIKINRKDEGFAELRIASHRNPQYFKDIITIVWNEKAGNADQTIKLLQPLDAIEKEKLSTFFFEKSEFAPIAQLNCHEEDLTEPYRDGLVRQLVEKNRYYVASQIYQRNCDTSAEIKSEIEDGGFESEKIMKGIGFGWRVRSTSRNTMISFDEENVAKGQSLRFNFNGQDSSYELLSQIVVVEKRRKYKLNFSYKTADIVTGSVPILQIILKKPDSDTSESIAGETRFSIKEKDWITSSIEFETDSQTEAIEIRLTRQPCAEPLCPIFGNLWLDDFSLQKKN